MNAAEDDPIRAPATEAKETETPANLKIGGADINIIFSPGKFDLPKTELVAWLSNAATIVTSFYGNYPVHHLRIHIVPMPGRGVKGGKAFGHYEAFIRLPVGINTQKEDLDKDWVAIHEMIHLAFPRVAPQHLWLSEGLAVYLESVARVQAGDLSQETIWADFIRDMPKGLPQKGDKGLDHTPTWGRRYWGGALFCLLADIGIRKQSNNSAGLQTAMKAVLKSGGNFETSWPIEKIMKTADLGTNTTALSDLYHAMASKPVSPDLGKLWHSLGVKQRNGKIILDDQARLAPYRKAIFKKQ